MSSAPTSVTGVAKASGPAAAPPTPAFGLAIGLTVCFGGLVTLVIFLRYARLLGKYRDSCKVTLELAQTPQAVDEAPDKPAPGHTIRSH